MPAIERDDVVEVTIKFKCGEPRTVTIERDENGVYNYTAMFWDTSSVVSILAPYYPSLGAKLTAELENAVTRPGRTYIDHEVGGKKVFDRKNIYPGDVLHLWEKHVLDEKPVRVIFKSGKSPIEALLEVPDLQIL